MFPAVPPYREFLSWVTLVSVVANPVMMTVPVWGVLRARKPGDDQGAFWVMIWGARRSPSATPAAVVAAESASTWGAGAVVQATRLVATPQIPEVSVVLTVVGP